MELLGIRLFNFVNFENMKLYSLPILNKILRYRKKIKALKTTKLILFPRRILSCKPDATHLRGHDQSNHLVTLIAAALNWSRNVMKGGVLLQHRWSAQRWADGINLWPNAVLAFNHLFGELTVCLGFVRILINIVEKCF